jgi:hypothetical protein
MFASSEMQKKRVEECWETGLYRFRVSSIFFSVTAATACFARISSESSFEEERI